MHWQDNVDNSLLFGPHGWIGEVFADSDGEVSGWFVAFKGHSAFQGPFDQRDQAKTYLWGYLMKHASL
jgi:hypothetical protein